MCKSTLTKATFLHLSSTNLGANGDSQTGLSVAAAWLICSLGCPETFDSLNKRLLQKKPVFGSCPLKTRTEEDSAPMTQGHSKRRRLSVCHVRTRARRTTKYLWEAHVGSYRTLVWQDSSFALSDRNCDSRPEKNVLFLVHARARVCVCVCVCVCVSVCLSVCLVCVYVCVCGEFYSCKLTSINTGTARLRRICEKKAKKHQLTRSSGLCMRKPAHTGTGERDRQKDIGPGVTGRQWRGQRREKEARETETERRV